MGFYCLLKEMNDHCCSRSLNFDLLITEFLHVNPNEDDMYACVQYYFIFSNDK